MACLLTQGITSPTCAEKFGAGGLRKVFFGNLSRIASYTNVTDGVITALTMTDPITDKFYVFDFEEDTANYIETSVRGKSGTFFRQEFNCVIQTRTTASRAAIKELIVSELVTIVEDNNGKKWLLGEKNGLRSPEGEGGEILNSGLKGDDASGYQLKLMNSKEPNLIQEFTGTVPV